MNLQIPRLLLLPVFALQVLATEQVTTPPFPSPTAFLPPGECTPIPFYSITSRLTILSIHPRLPHCGIPGWTEVPGTIPSHPHPLSLILFHPFVPFYVSAQPHLSTPFNKQTNNNLIRNYTETTHQQTGSDLQCCLNECRASNGVCKSIAFDANYTLCLWYNQIVEGTQLTRGEESWFVHWDLGCYVD